MEKKDERRGGYDGAWKRGKEGKEERNEQERGVQVARRKKKKKIGLVLKRRTCVSRDLEVHIVKGGKEGQREKMRKK